MANGIQYSIRLSARAKRECLREMERRKPRRSRTMHRVLLFATLVYLLLKDHVGQLERVTIDVEYRGYESMIKDHVSNLFKRRGQEFGEDVVAFNHIGKKSPAHDLAISVFRGVVPPDREITAEDILPEV
jgi:hypothetical protein